MYLFLAFLLVPIIEIALFIQVGSLIGLWPTLAIVVLTAVLGTVLVRTQGRMALGQLQKSFAELDDPTEPLAHGAMILFSGALLLTPGFFTDAVGFLLLVPGVRSSIFDAIRRRIVLADVQFGPSNPQRHQPDIVDAEFEDLDSPAKQQGPSGWTRH